MSKHYVKEHYMVIIYVHMLFRQGKSIKKKVGERIKREGKYRRKIRQIIKWLKLPPKVPLSSKEHNMEEALCVLWTLQ